MNDWIKKHILIRNDSGAKLSKNQIYNKINFQGLFVSIIILLGLFGPWLVYSYDSYSTINSETKMGQLNYRSKIELNPLFGSLFTDDILVERIWFVSVGTNMAGLLLIISVILSIFKFNNNLAHFILFIIASLGIIIFFGSIGSGISFGLFTKVGWGLKLTGFGIMLFFIVSFKEMSKNNISRFMD